MAKACVVCGETEILDQHHHKNETAWLCPNHHQMIHRHITYSLNPIYNPALGKDIDPTQRLTLTEILGEIKKIEQKGKPHYEKVRIYRAADDWIERDRIKHSELYSWLKDMDDKGKEEYLKRELIEYKSNYAIGHRILEKSEMISEEPKCIYCGYNKILEIHHNKEGKTVFLCPNHHAINHREKPSENN